MAMVHANKILTKFMLLLGGHYHSVKVSSDSETVRGMGRWEFVWCSQRIDVKLHRGSYMSAHVLLNLLIDLRERDKKRGSQRV